LLDLYLPEGNVEIYIATCQLTIVSPIQLFLDGGLIAMAGILGIVGFMVMRRKKAAA